MAGLAEAVALGIVGPGDTAVVDSTAHALKFSVFQDMYFNDGFDPAFEVKPDPALRNKPLDVIPKGLKAYPEPGAPLEGDLLTVFVKAAADDIAGLLRLTRKTDPKV